MGRRLIQYLAFVLLAAVLGKSPPSPTLSSRAHPAAPGPWTEWPSHKVLERSIERERVAEIAQSAATTTMTTTATEDSISVDQSADRIDTATTPLLVSYVPRTEPSELDLLDSSTTKPVANITFPDGSEYVADYLPDSTTMPDYEDTTASELAMDNSSVSVFSNRSSGRALSHDDVAAWQAKSTKIIGTIIEDIRPFRENTVVLTLGAIVAITMCILIVIASVAGMSGYWWYRRRDLNRPETLSERYNPSEGIAEDVFRVGYINSPDFPRDSSEEMYSLDNDSFLTSLEAMTIPTYWTENIKHTKL